MCRGQGRSRRASWRDGGVIAQAAHEPVVPAITNGSRSVRISPQRATRAGPASGRISKSPTRQLRERVAPASLNEPSA